MRSWLLGGCWRHADPIFDRDATGPIFRCPRCLQTWPRLTAGDGTWRPEVQHAADQAIERARTAAWWTRVTQRRKSA
jgi:hypothetical protein